MNNEITKLLAGKKVQGVRVIWDRQCPENEGAFARYDDGRADEPLEFDRWSDGSENGGVHVSEYFDVDGEYRGPDQNGVYPVLA